jgi:hypothetical protein
MALQTIVNNAQIWHYFFMAIDRGEWPQEWILSPGGDPNNDDGYTYVKCGVYYRNPDTHEQFHVGVTAFGEIIGSWSPGGPGALIYGEVRALDTNEIPPAALQKLTTEALLQIGSFSGNLVLGALGVELPPDLEPVEYAKLFNGTDEEKKVEHAKIAQWQQIAEELRPELIT